ncbi:MAG: PTS glucose transporter subunit IIA [Alteromonadaceae bacterium]|nr:PTS glucose transporter subunit IIA [Alteromonadaceae bacterium]
MDLFGNLCVGSELPPHKKKIPISAPLNGRVKPLDEHPHFRFKLRLMGEGVLVEPSGYQIVAPLDCIVEHFNPTCEQIRLKSKAGIRLVIQVGINAEKMMGEGFKPRIKVGQIVKAGTTILEFDLPKMKRQLDSTVFAVTVMNSDKLKGVVPNYRQVRAMEDEIMNLLV